MHQLKRLQWLFLATLLAALTLAGCASPREQVAVSNFQPARVDQASTHKSFWKDSVHYAFPVKYAKASDSRGVNWEIAYMDEYHGSKTPKAEAKTLVLVHGKGASAGYWSELMRDALGAGLRVVAFDIPGYGKSIPGNLNNPRTRTLQDTREAVNKLPGQLGVKKATFLGHSMGGQWVIGYAVDYPQQVEKLILEAPAGLEEYTTVFKLPGGDLPWLDPKLARDLKGWEKVWAVTGRMEKARSRDAEFFKNFYWFKQKNAQTGAIEPAKVGFFLNDGADARFETATRVGMFEGPRAEHDLYIFNTEWDVFTMGIETRKEDPKSLVKRLSEIRVPVFIAFGKQEPFIPTTVASGNTDLKFEVIRPAYQRLSQNGPAPKVKLYDNAAHFPHTDQPAMFNKDVIDFVFDGDVQGTEDVGSWKAPAVKLPADITAFFDADRAAVVSAKPAEIMKHYHKDFRSDGRDWNAQNDLMKAWASAFAEKYEVKVTGLDIQGDKALLTGTLTTQFGTAPLNGTYLIKEGGKWYWYGNRK